MMRLTVLKKISKQLKVKFQFLYDAINRLTVDKSLEISLLFQFLYDAINSCYNRK